MLLISLSKIVLVLIDLWVHNQNNILGKYELSHLKFSQFLPSLAIH